MLALALLGTIAALILLGASLLIRRNEAIHHLRAALALVAGEAALATGLLFSMGGTSAYAGSSALISAADAFAVQLTALGAVPTGFMFFLLAAACLHEAWNQLLSTERPLVLPARA